MCHRLPTVLAIALTICPTHVLGGIARAQETPSTSRPEDAASSASNQLGLRLDEFRKLQQRLDDQDCILVELRSELVSIELRSPTLGPGGIHSEKPGSGRDAPIPLHQVQRITSPCRATDKGALIGSIIFGLGGAAAGIAIADSFGGGILGNGSAATTGDLVGGGLTGFMLGGFAGAILGAGVGFLIPDSREIYERP